MAKRKTAKKAAKARKPKKAAKPAPKKKRRVSKPAPKPAAVQRKTPPARRGVGSRRRAARPHARTAHPVKARLAHNPYDKDLDRNPANYQPLTPITFLERAAAVYPRHTAIIHGPLRRTYAEFYARARKLASALAKRGIKLR